MAHDGWCPGALSLIGRSRPSTGSRWDRWRLPVKAGTDRRGQHFAVAILLGQRDMNWLFTNQGVGSAVGVCGVAAGWRGRGPPKMKVPTRLIWKTSTCPTLPSLPLI